MDWEYKLYRNFRKEKNKIAAKWFSSKGHKVHPRYPFILEKKDNWEENILLPTVYSYVQNEIKKALANKTAYPIHGYIHHGLSSQAMIFNLFGELIINKDYDALFEIFSYPELNIDYNSILSFEHCNRKTFNEFQQQPTSFDFAIVNTIGKSIFLESKLVETEFGNCSMVKAGECDGSNPTDNPDRCYLTHKKRKYWELMKKHDLHIPYISSPICPMAIYYQFFRELLFALENNGYYVILIDKNNPAFIKGTFPNERGLFPTLTKNLPEKIKLIVKILYIQDILLLLEKFKYSWVEDFRVKYGIVR